MNKNKSIKNFLLGALLVLMALAIFELIQTNDKGKMVTLSEFVAMALPATDGTGNRASGGVAEVVVHRGGTDDVLEWAVRPVGQKADEASAKNPADPAAPAPAAEAPAPAAEPDTFEWFHTRGSVDMALGGPNDFTLLSVLSEGGVRVTFKDGTTATPRGTQEAFSVLVAQAQKLQAPTDIASITIRGKEVTGKRKDGNAFTTVGELGDYRQELIRRGVQVTEENEAENSVWMSILGTWLPMLVILGIFLLFMRQLQSGGGKAMSFGKSRHRILNEATNKVTFKDIAGIDEAKAELQEIIEFLRDPKKFTRLGGRIPKGVLLMGPPGTGKTLLGKGVAGEAGVPFFSISGSDFVEMFVGVGASRVRDLFEQGKKNAPCIIFIDEIDAVGRQRGAGMGGGHDEREQTLNQLLVEMDGFESNDGVILIAATNRPDVLDPALMRPGRFDRRVVVSLPDAKGRSAILKVHTRKTKIAPGVNLDAIARGTPGFSGAELENLVNEAVLLAARRDKNRVETEDFEDAKDKVMMGAERRSLVLSDADKRITAVHEAGHTLVTCLVKGNDPIHKVTIIPRGMALGVTWTLPEADHTNLTKEQILARIAMAMGGRVAEAAVFGQITTGAGNDIKQATKLAQRMVNEWGMSELGPIALTKEQGSVFLGRDFGRGTEFSGQTLAEADNEVRRIINEQHAIAEAVMVSNRKELDALTEALLEFETLDNAECGLLIAGEPMDVLRERRAKAAAEADRHRVAKQEAEPPAALPTGAAEALVSGMQEPTPASMRSRID